MKEKTNDIEGHRIKAGLDPPTPGICKSPTTATTNSTSSSIATVSTTKPTPASAATQAKDSQNNTLFSTPTSVNNKNEESIEITKDNLTPTKTSTPTSNTNFDDDYNEWDISIGDLIIDLDADIERQSEGDKCSPTIEAKAVTSSVESPPTKTKPTSGEAKSVMSSSNLKSSNRLCSSSLPSATTNNVSSSSSINNINSSSTKATSVVIGTTNTNTTSISTTNGSSGSSSMNHHHHHHGHSQRNSFGSSAATGSVPALINSSAVAVGSATPTKPGSMVEHHATVEKGLKMKIKRKSIGGKISETKHEIVSSDISTSTLQTASLPKSQPFATSFDSTTIVSPATSVTPNSTKVPSPPVSLIPVLHPSSSTNSSVITANQTVDSSSSTALGCDGSLSKTSLSTSLSKHSNKNKSVHHRDKKDKIKFDKEKSDKGDKEKLNNSTSLPSTGTIQGSTGKSKPTNIEDCNDSAMISSVNQTGIPNLTLKYSTTPSSGPTTTTIPSPTVIIKSDGEGQVPRTMINNNGEIVPVSCNQVKKVKSEYIDENISERKTVGTSTSVSTITEPDCLGPCEPGTSVTLEGIVWQETEGGVLVVNVTWRGKTYVGTLLDCTKHDWAPPRFCESPTSDIESKSMKNTRGKRARNNFAAEASIDTRSVTSKLRNGKGRRTANSGYVPPSPAKSDSSLNSNSKRKGRPSDLDLSTVDQSDASKRNRLSKPDTPDQPTAQPGTLSNTPGLSLSVQTPTSPQLIECPEPNCSKKYKHINGLKYHQSHAHIGSTFNISDSQEYDQSESQMMISKDDGSDCDDSQSQTEEFIATETNLRVKGMDGMKMKVCDDQKSKRTCANDNVSDNGEEEENKPNGATDDNVDQLSDNPFNGSMDLKKTATKNADDEIENVASPAYSDISDDVNSNDNQPTASTAATTVSTSTAASNNNELSQLGSTLTNVSETNKIDSTSTSEKQLKPQVAPQPQTQPVPQTPQSSSSSIANISNNYGLSSFPQPSFFNHHQPSSFMDHQPKTVGDVKSPTESDGLQIDPKNPYSYPFYRFNQMHGQPSQHEMKSVGEKAINNSSPTNNSHGKPSESIDHGERNSGKHQPIVELQNLKNRIQNYAFDQAPLYEQNQKRFLMESEKEKLKDKVRHSPQKSQKESDLKDNNNKQHLLTPMNKDEGVKPTMETTGPPPPPTNGFYYNPSFLPHSFAPLSPFESMLRNTIGANSAMNHMMAAAAAGGAGSSPFGPHGPPPPPPPTSGGPFSLHHSMRFPLDGLPSMTVNSIPNRSTVQSPSSGTTTIAKQQQQPPTSSHQSQSSSSSSSHSHHHHHSSYNHSSNKSDRSNLLSPNNDRNNIPSSSTSSSSSHSMMNSVSALAAAGYHKSPSKEYSGSNVPPSSVSSDHRATMANAAAAAAAAAMQHHPPRHPFNSAYPIFDPYSAMIVNHAAANSVPMHPFTPK